MLNDKISCLFLKSSKGVFIIDKNYIINRWLEEYEHRTIKSLKNYNGGDPIIERLTADEYKEYILGKQASREGICFVYSKAIQEKMKFY